MHVFKRILGPGLLTGIVLLSSVGCTTTSSKKKAKALEEQRQRESKALYQPLGQVQLVSDGNFVLIRVANKNVANSKMDADTYRGSEKTGHIKFTGEMKNGWAAADIKEGKPAVGDLAMRRNVAPLPETSLASVGLPPPSLDGDPNLLPALQPPPGEAYPMLDGAALPPLAPPPGVDPALAMPEAMPALPDAAGSGLPELRSPPGAEEILPMGPPPLEDWAKPNWQGDRITN